MKLNAILLGAAVALAGLPSLFASAATVTGNMPVTSSVVANCTVDAAIYAPFNGTYSPVTNKTAALQGNQGMNVLCTKGTVYTVVLSQGANADSGSTCDAPARRLKSADGNFLNYSLYTNSSYSNFWGCGTSNSVTKTALNGTGPFSFIIGVSVAAGQDVPAGSYVDQVTATVSF
jgi:spore coat protein U-like protein